jgi:hypothetical protein
MTDPLFKSLIESFDSYIKRDSDIKLIEKAYIFDKKDDAYSKSKSTEIKWKGEAPNIKVVKKKVKKGGAEEEEPMKVEEGAVAAAPLPEEGGRRRKRGTRRRKH